MTSRRAKSPTPKARGKKRLTLNKQTLKNLTTTGKAAAGVRGGGAPIRTGAICPQAGNGTDGCQS
jgi:hypothetical protein